MACWFHIKKIGSPPDLLGLRKGLLVVIGLGAKRGHIYYWKVRCDCGMEKEVAQNQLSPTHRTFSCGCTRGKLISLANTKHGHNSSVGRSRELVSWTQAKDRCFNKNSHNYRNYGGRGITMCKEWAEDFQAFFRELGTRPSGKTLDRIDVNGNYEPGNCRWATAIEQARNRRR